MPCALVQSSVQWLVDRQYRCEAVHRKMCLYSASLWSYFRPLFVVNYIMRSNLKYAISIQRKNLSVWLVRYMYVPFTYLGDTEFEQLDTRHSAVRWNNLKFAHWLIKNSNPLPYVWSMDNSLFLWSWKDGAHWSTPSHHVELPWGHMFSVLQSLCVWYIARSYQTLQGSSFSTKWFIHIS